MSTFPARLPHLSLRALAAAAFLALAARPAAAQPACASGTLASYLAPDFSCTIGGFLIEGFLYESLGQSNNAFATIPDEETATLNPFTGVDARGRPTFGFNFSGFTAVAGVTNSTAGSEFADASYVLGFFGTSQNPSLGLARAGVDFQLNNVVNDGPARFSRLGEFVGFTVGSGFSEICLLTFADNVGQQSRSFSRERRCPRPRPSGFAFFAIAAAELERDGDGLRPIDGTVTAQLDQARFIVGPRVIPEPSTYALVGGGLLALGLVARRRVRAAVE